jgi:hypothetical protein
MTPPSTPPKDLCVIMLCSLKMHGMAPAATEPSAYDRPRDWGDLAQRMRYGRF